MRFFKVTLALLVMSCSTNNSQNQLFEDLKDQETVVIFLSQYGLDSIPAEIGNLKSATTLYIKKDEKDTVGWTVYPPLSAFQNPVFSEPFRKLPTEISQRQKLKGLNLSNLDIHELPDSFEDLRNLTKLDLSFNKLTIADEIGHLKPLKKLKYLRLTGNKVDSTDIAVLKAEIPGISIRSRFDE